MNDIIIDKRNLLGYKIESGNHYRSIPCTMVLRLMDTEEYCNNYCRALDLVLKLFPEIDRAKLEKELDQLFISCTDIEKIKEFVNEENE